MALVSYGYSDSEEDNSEEVEDEISTVSTNVGNVNIIGKETKENVPALFTYLPIPKYGTIQDVPDANEEEIDYLPATVCKKKQASVKITIPAKISDLIKDDEPSKIKRPKLSAGSIGLFSLLPPPKIGTVNPATKFVPNSVVKKISQPETLEIDSQINDSSSEDENEKGGGLHYFSSILENTTALENHKTDIVIESAKSVTEELIRNNRYFSDLYSGGNAFQEQPKDAKNVVEDDIMKDAYIELVGRSRKAKGRRNGSQEMKVIEINATDIMPDPREWMTKSLTEEQPMPTVKKGDEPSIQHKRKHQITYLAYQAKLNEHELKNQWALNKMSRKQTQAKYGF